MDKARCGILIPYLNVRQLTHSIRRSEFRGSLAAFIIRGGRKSVYTSIGVCAVLINSAVALGSSEFKLKSGINRFPYGLPPFIPF